MELKNYAIGTLTVLLLISLGMNVMPDDTHVCRDKELTMKCDRLSSTGNTCYPTESTRIGSKYCSSGWEEIFKKDTIDFEILIPAKANYICYPDRCIKQTK